MVHYSTFNNNIQPCNKFVLQKLKETVANFLITYQHGATGLINVCKYTAPLRRNKCERQSALFSPGKQDTEKVIKNRFHSRL